MRPEPTGIDAEAIAEHLALLARAGVVTAEPGEQRRVRYRRRSAPTRRAHASNCTRTISAQIGSNISRRIRLCSASWS